MPGKLELITDLLDIAWEDLIYDRATELPTIFEVANIDAKWIERLKPLLGFTRDLSFEATVDELRRLLMIAVEYWNDKPTEEGVIADAIRMVTGNRFRVANWFDFRMQTDTTVITEELEDFDPYALGFESFKSQGTQLSTLAGGGGFSVDDLAGFPLGFETAHMFWWLVVFNDTGVPSNDGIYPIDFLVPWGGTGKIKGVFPANRSPIEWVLIGYADEYVSEVRLVDDGIGTLAYDGLTVAFTPGELLVGVVTGAKARIVSDASGVLSLRAIFGRFQNNEAITDSAGGAAVADGKLTGVMNRELMQFLMDGDGKTQRPFSERIDVVYINFLDQFNVASDLDQWTLTGAVTSADGEATLPVSTVMVDAHADSPNWGDQVTAWKIRTDDATGIMHLLFFYSDVDNQYFVEVDYALKTVKLFRKVATVDTQLGATATLSYLKVGVQDVIRVDALKEGLNTRVRVKVNGNTEIDAADAPSSFLVGRAGARADAGTVKLLLCEVNVLPTEVQRIGPTP